MCNYLIIYAQPRWRRWAFRCRLSPRRAPRSCSLYIHTYSILHYTYFTPLNTSLNAPFELLNLLSWEFLGAPRSHKIIISFSITYPWVIRYYLIINSSNLTPIIINRITMSDPRFSCCFCGSASLSFKLLARLPGVCSGGGRGFPPESLNGLTRNPLSRTR